MGLQISFLLFHAILLLLCLFTLRFINRSGVHKGDLELIFFRHPRSNSLRYCDPCLCLIILQDSTDDPSHGAHSGVQHVAVFSRLVLFFGLTKSDPETSGLVVKAVGTGNQFSESTASWEPSF